MDFDLLNGGITGEDPLNTQTTMEHNDNQSQPSENKEIEEFLTRITTLVIGLFNWIHKSDMTKCWILDALQQIRRILRDIGGYSDYLEEINSILKRDANHQNFEVRLRVRQAIKFDIDIRKLGIFLTV